jgi:hypothetical protein
MSMKNSNTTIGDRTLDILAFKITKSLVLQNVRFVVLLGVSQDMSADEGSEGDKFAVHGDTIKETACRTASLTRCPLM